MITLRQEGITGILTTESVNWWRRNVFYNITETFGIFAGYNSLREGTFGLQVRFFHEKQY